MTSGFLYYLRVLLPRLVYYKLSFPKVPIHPEPFDGPVVVVGSAPVSHVPAGFNESFRVITVNGSQRVTKAWGLGAPHVTFMQYNQIEGTNTNAVAVRRVLNGERTGLLYIIRWRHNLKRLTSGLAAFNYQFDQLKTLRRVDRMALFNTVTGQINLEANNDIKSSTGITAVLYAFNSGAKTVIISGIDPDSSGHVYNDANLKRQHTAADRDMLLALHKRGFGIYTADPNVARSSGLPLWTGHPRAN
jgi:hypothetical protein